MPGQRRYGIVDGEKPAVLHRLGTLSRRTVCGKPIVLVPAGEQPRLVVCKRCVAIDEARRAGMPEWTEAGFER
jgi:hypothetical protein